MRRRRSPRQAMPAEGSRRQLLVGTSLYAAAALADMALTLSGMKGDLSLEGNPVMRSVMARLGAPWGLVLEKAAVGCAFALLALFLEPEIKRNAGWIWKVPSTPWARAWLRRGDRSWIAYVPLYGAAAFQLLAALSWVALR